MSTFENTYCVNPDTPNEIPSVEDISKAREQFVREYFLLGHPETHLDAPCVESDKTVTKNPYLNPLPRMLGDCKERFIEEYLVIASRSRPCILLCHCKNCLTIMCRNVGGIDQGR